MSTDERMEKTEGQLARVRWFNRCLIACIVLGLGVWFIEEYGVEEIRAKRFVVEDENGKNRAALTAGKDGPALILLDENDKTRALLGTRQTTMGDGKVISPDFSKPQRAQRTQRVKCLLLKKL